MENSIRFQQRRTCLHNVLCWLLGASVLRKRLVFRTDVPSSQHTCGSACTSFFKQSSQGLAIVIGSALNSQCNIKETWLSRKREWTKVAHFQSSHCLSFCELL